MRHRFPFLVVLQMRYALKRKGNCSAREPEHTRWPRPPEPKSKLDAEDTRIGRTAGAACRKTGGQGAGAEAPSGKTDTPYGGADGRLDAALRLDQALDRLGHPLHHPVDVEVRGVDEGVARVVGERRVGAGAVAQVAARQLGDHLLQSQLAAAGGELAEAAQAAHLGAGVEEELEQ